VWRQKGYNGPLHLIPQFGVDPAIYYRRERPMRRGRVSVFKQRTVRPSTQPALAIGYVGRLVEEKGLETLLQAASRLTGPWTLQILGSGPDRERLERMTQWLGIAPRVTFDQRMPSTHLPHYFSGLDVFVLPSLTRPNWKEQFGRVLIEAMACGAVTVGADSGAIPEVIGEAGLTFAEGNVDELQAQLQGLIDDVALREALRQRGRQRVKEQYTQAAIAQNTVTVYRQILGQSAPETIGLTAQEPAPV
jgi:glycosyltransferase involved in cell wall biosynthesis